MSSVHRALGYGDEQRLLAIELIAYRSHEALAQGKLPGAVLVIGHDGKIVCQKAYGKRALVPRPEDMTLDTVFDCASLTKVIATTSSVTKLFEQGRFRLNDKTAGPLRARECQQQSDVVVVGGP